MEPVKVANPFISLFNVEFYVRRTGRFRHRHGVLQVLQKVSPLGAEDVLLRCRRYAVYIVTPTRRTLPPNRHKNVLESTMTTTGVY